MTINFDEAKVLTLVKTFNGTTEDGRKFTITAEWNDFDDWAVTDIDWDGEEGTEDEEEEIEEMFFTHMLN